MVTFCSDVDGTLIYYVSRLMELPECVPLQCKNQFTTKRSHQLLQEMREKVEFLPVTARSVEKYREIADDLGNPNFALVCNITGKWRDSYRVAARVEGFGGKVGGGL